MVVVRDMSILSMFLSKFEVYIVVITSSMYMVDLPVFDEGHQSVSQKLNFWSRVFEESRTILKIRL